MLEYILECKFSDLVHAVTVKVKVKVKIDIQIIINRGSFRYFKSII